MQRDEETTSTNGRLRESTVMLVSPSSSLTSSTSLGSSMAGLGEDIRRWRMISPLVLSALRYRLLLPPPRLHLSSSPSSHARAYLCVYASRGSTIHHMGVWASFMAGVAATGWGLSNMLLDRALPSCSLHAPLGEARLTRVPLLPLLLIHVIGLSNMNAQRRGRPSWGWASRS